MKSLFTAPLMISFIAGCGPHQNDVSNLSRAKMTVPYVVCESSIDDKDPTRDGALYAPKLMPTRSGHTNPHYLLEVPELVSQRVGRFNSHLVSDRKGVWTFEGERMSGTISSTQVKIDFGYKKVLKWRVDTDKKTATMDYMLLGSGKIETFTLQECEIHTYKI